MADNEMTVDVLVVGSGQGAMTAALSAYEMGARDVLLVEKGKLMGGTSALSGGVIWIPCNRHAKAAGQQDSFAEAMAYMRRTIPDDVRREDVLQAYVENGPRMIDFLESRSDVLFSSLAVYPDYHAEVEGGKLGHRALEPVPFDSGLLGEDDTRVSQGHQNWYFMGRIPLSLSEVGVVQGNLKGWRTLMAKLVMQYVFDVPQRLRSRYGRWRKNGAAAVARLFYSLKKRGVPMWSETAMRELISENGRVTGAIIERDGKRITVKTRKGVVLSAGGFDHNQKLREHYLPAPTNEAWSIGVPTNTGDALTAAVKVGAKIDLMRHSWWCMTMNVPDEERPRLCIIEKALPGSCLVNQRGRRFLDESENYQALVENFHKAHTAETPCWPCWLVFDARYRRDYIVGPLLTPRLRPDWSFPKSWYEKGFLARAKTIEELAHKTGMDVAGLAGTIARMNDYAKTGKDLEFNRGETAYGRHYGDPKFKPNPNLAPINEAPFYALRVNPGDIGTGGGLVTNAHGQVMGENGTPIPGLYASGNCTAAVMPTYPGPGATIGPAMVFAYQAAKHMTGYNEAP